MIQLLRYAIRPSRAENTPRLKGLYVFGPKDSSDPKAQPYDGVKMGVAATIGSSWNQKSSDHLSQSLYGTSEKWYRRSGKMVKKEPLSDWASILVECKDIISFDAPLCTGPRHSAPVQTSDPKTQSKIWYQKEESYIPPRVATFALEGCSSCGKAPEGLAKFGQCPADRFPLLSPVPIHNSTIKAAKVPDVSSKSSVQPKIMARCQDCLRNRYCEHCYKWWCEDCYDVSSKGHNLHPIGIIYPPQSDDAGLSSEKTSKVMDEDERIRLESNHVKVYSGLCVQDCLIGDLLANDMWG